MAACGQGRGERTRTALAAIMAGTPGLGLTAAAAATSDALVVQADLVLSLLDMAALLAIAVAVQRGTARAEWLAHYLVTLSMIASLVMISWLSLARLTMPALAEGAGLWLALILNSVHAPINGWLLVRWRRAHRSSPSPATAGQMRLFADKLTSNLLISGSIAATVSLGDHRMAPLVDPAAGLAMVAATIWWTGPAIMATLCRVAESLGCALPSESRRPH